jgi:1-acyl-sn-glycerol-3-phosphate acyltransferase
MFFSFVRLIARIIAAVFYRVRAEGAENFPKEGALVLCANHTFNKDLIFISCFAPRKIYWMAKAELFRIPVFNIVIRMLGAFPVDRGARDKKSVKTVYKILNDGAPLGIFPEGKRVLDPVDRPPFKRGFVSFAANSGAAILPVAVSYSDGPLGRGRLFSGAMLTFGEVIKLESGRKYGRDELDEISASIMNWIHGKLKP